MVAHGFESPINVLVTGGGGRLGQALASVGGGAVMGLRSAELDITDASAFRNALDRLRPNAVVNAATVGVETSETDPERSRLVNAVAPGQMAQACEHAGIPFIHVSTDYVFGNAPGGPWRESDPVSPMNGYGRSKAEGEIAALAAGQAICIARVAWLFGDRQDFIARLLRGQPDTVRITHDQVGSPTPIFGAARRLLDLASRMVAGDPIPRILHLAGSPPVSRADWVATALDGLRRAGKPAPHLVRVPMSAFASRADRPHFSALDSGLAAEIFGGELDWRPLTMRPDTFCD